MADSDSDSINDEASACQKCLNIEVQIQNRQAKAAQGPLTFAEGRANMLRHSQEVPDVPPCVQPSAKGKVCEVVRPVASLLRTNSHIVPQVIKTMVEPNKDELMKKFIETGFTLMGINPKQLENPMLNEEASEKSLKIIIEPPPEPPDPNDEGPPPQGDTSLHVCQASH